MLKKLSLIFGVLLMVNALLLTTTKVTNANPIDPVFEKQKETLIQNAAEFNKNSKEVVLNDKQLQKIKDIVTSGNLKLHHNDLKFDETFVKKYKSDRYVYIPIAHDEVSNDMNYSHLALVLNNKDEVVNYMEFNILGNDKNYTAKVEFYNNGTLLKDETIQLNQSDFEGDSSITLPGEKEANALNWWGRFSRCMNNMGVASWAVGVLATVCSGVCVATLGAGCVACIVGAGLASEGIAAKCVTEASLKKK